MPFIKHVKPKEICRNPEHEPPGMIVLEDGVHTWQCPGCGETTTFTVSNPTL